MTRDKAAQWIQIIHDDIRDAYIQNDLFCQFHAVIRDNERLSNSQNVFLYWVNTLFKDSTVMAVRRQTDRHRDCISLWRLLSALQADPDIAHGRVTSEQIQADIDGLDRQLSIIQGYADRRVAHADPQDLHDGTPTFRDVATCIDHLCEVVNRYATVVSDAQLSTLPPRCGTAWKEIFTFPWIEDAGGPQNQ